MYDVKELFIPQSLEEALNYLEEHPETRPLAGGTDILVGMKRGKLGSIGLLCLNRLPELKGIRERDDGVIEIGAMSTFTDIAENELIAQRMPMLKTAALAMGGYQIQNTATVGGNLCNGAPSADSAPPLLAFGAILVIHSAGGVRRMPVSDFYEAPGRVRLEPKELLVTIEIPAQKSARRGDCYIKFSTRKSMDLALTSCAAICDLTEDGVIQGAAIALGVSAPTPIRAFEAEKNLVGKRLSHELLDETAELTLATASPRTSWRASKEYRRQLIRVLTKDAVEAAYKNAGGELLCAL